MFKSIYEFGCIPDRTGEIVPAEDEGTDSILSALINFYNAFRLIMIK